MAFVVEDGTGIPEANAYHDVDFLRDYFGERGITFDEDDATIQTWIVQATDYIESIFGWRLIGYPTNAGQGLHFPAKEAVTRQGVLLADDAIPLTLKRASSQYARRVKDGPLLPDPVVDATGFSVVTTREKIGPIENEFKIMGSSGQPILVRSYPEADALMTDLLRYDTGGARVIR